MKRRILLPALLTLAACGSGGGGGDGALPPFDSAAGVVVHDFDGDGLLDVAVAVATIAGPPPHAGSVKVWLQRSDAPDSFRPATRYAVGPDPTVLRVADVDADGVPDLVVMSSHASAVDGSPLVDEVTVLRGDPAQRGRFLAGTTLRAGARLSDIVVGDLDGDGLPDIAFSSYDVGARLGVWWNDAAAPGRFGAPVALVDGATAALATADLDGDGRNDLAFVAGDAAWALLRDPAATRGFRAPVRLADEPLPTCLAAVDLDRDGRSDLVLGSRASTDFGAPGALQTLRSDAALPGRFVPLQRVALALRSWHCIVADFDGDGAPDLATTGGGWAGDLLDDIVEVFLGDPANPGQLRPAVRTVTNDTGSGLYLAAGDLDGDGRPDVAIPYQGGVLVLRQDPARPGALLRAPALP
ncbi:MAG: VCBS repeat-containing protein [Rubrivivax sp.]|nr:VCBS repeat-containing protein [Rubrivivax sp.]